jgi:hypothetical protein
LIHLDIKKLGRIGRIGHRMTGGWLGVVKRHRGVGWQFVHVAIDDASRISLSQVMADDRQHSAVAFLDATLGYYAGLGIRSEVVTTNGKAKRFIQTSLREWAYARPYTSSGLACPVRSSTCCARTERAGATPGCRSILKSETNRMTGSGAKPTRKLEAPVQVDPDGATNGPACCWIVTRHLKKVPKRNDPRFRYHLTHRLAYCCEPCRVRSG